MQQNALEDWLNSGIRIGSGPLRSPTWLERIKTDCSSRYLPPAVVDKKTGKAQPAAPASAEATLKVGLCQAITEGRSDQLEQLRKAGCRRTELEKYGDFVETVIKTEKPCKHTKPICSVLEVVLPSSLTSPSKSPKPGGQQPSPLPLIPNSYCEVTPKWTNPFPAFSPSPIPEEGGAAPAPAPPTAAPVVADIKGCKRVISHAAKTKKEAKTAGAKPLVQRGKNFLEPRDFDITLRDGTARIEYKSNSGKQKSLIVVEPPVMGGVTFSIKVKKDASATPGDLEIECGVAAAKQETKFMALFELVWDLHKKGWSSLNQFVVSMPHSKYIMKKILKESKPNGAAVTWPIFRGDELFGQAWRSSPILVPYASAKTTPLAGQFCVSVLSALKSNPDNRKAVLAGLALMAMLKDGSTNEFAPASADSRLPPTDLRLIIAQRIIMAKANFAAGDQRWKADNFTSVFSLLQSGPDPPSSLCETVKGLLSSGLPNALDVAKLTKSNADALHNMCTSGAGKTPTAAAVQKLLDFATGAKESWLKEKVNPVGQLTLAELQESCGDIIDFSPNPQPSPTASPAPAPTHAH